MPTRESIDRPTRERLRLWLEHFRAINGDTQAQLATRLKIQQSTISKILDGSRTMGMDVFIRVARTFLGVSTSDMINADPPKTARR